MGIAEMVPYYYDERIVSRMLLTRSHDDRKKSLSYVYMQLAQGIEEIKGYNDWYRDIHDQVLLCNEIVGKVDFEQYFEIVFSTGVHIMKVIPQIDDGSGVPIKPLGFGGQDYSIIEVDGSEDLSKFRRTSFDGLLPVSVRNDMVSANCWPKSNYKNNIWNVYDRKINVPEKFARLAVIKMLMNRLMGNWQRFKEYKCVMLKQTIIVMRAGKNLRIGPGSFTDPKIIVPYYCQVPRAKYISFLDSKYEEAGLKRLSEIDQWMLPEKGFKCKGYECDAECNIYDCHYEYAKRKIAMYRKIEKVSDVVTVEFLMWFFGDDVSKMILKGVKECLIPRDKGLMAVQAVRASSKRSLDVTELLELISFPENFAGARERRANFIITGDRIGEIDDEVSQGISYRNTTMAIVKDEIATTMDELIETQSQVVKLMDKAANLKRRLDSDKKFLGSMREGWENFLAKQKANKMEFLKNQKPVTENERVRENSSKRRKLGQ